MYCSTLNINYLNLLSDEQLDHIKKYINKIYNDSILKNKVQNLTAFSLLYNHFNNLDKLPNYKEIGGITDLTEMKSEKYGLHIYFFGENHYEGYICRNESQIVIDKYLNKLLINTDKFIDVFIEEHDDILTRNFTVSCGYMTKFTEKNRECFTPLIEKNKCKYKNTRFHYTDYRRKYKSLSNEMSTLDYFLDDRAILGKSINSIYNRIIKGLNNYTDDHGYLLIEEMHKSNPETGFKNFFEYGKIKKQFDKLDPEMKYIVNQTYQVELNEDIIHLQMKDVTISKIKERVKYILKNEKGISIEERIQKIKHYIRRISDFLIAYNMWAMDAYLVCRLLRKQFNTSGIVDKRKYYPSKMGNVIVYSGAGHTETIVNWLTRIGSFESIKLVRPGIACIKMEDKIKQPFFSEDIRINPLSNVILPSKIISDVKPVVKPVIKPVIKPVVIPVFKPVINLDDSDDSDDSTILYTRIQLEKMTVVQLKALCKSRNISYCNSRNGQRQRKADIINTLLNV